MARYLLTLILALLAGCAQFFYIAPVDTGSEQFWQNVRPRNG